MSKIFRLPITLLYCFLLLSIVLIGFSSCSKNIKKTNATSIPLDNTSSTDREYIKEGFITKDLYRIIIVEPKDEIDYPKTSIEKTAKRRAFVSLQKYLSANNILPDKNINANLLNLIGEYGTIKEAPGKSKTRKVHLFEIKKSNLKQSLDNLSTTR